MFFSKTSRYLSQVFFLFFLRFSFCALGLLGCLSNPVFPDMAPGSLRARLPELARAARTLRRGDVADAHRCTKTWSIKVDGVVCVLPSFLPGCLCVFCVCCLVFNCCSASFFFEFYTRCAIYCVFCMYM